MTAQEWLLAVGMLVGITWVAAFLLVLRDRTQPLNGAAFGPDDHVGLGFYARRDPVASLPTWKKVLAIPLFVAVSPGYIVVIIVVLPVAVWASLCWCWARFQAGRTRRGTGPGGAPDPTA